MADTKRLAPTAETLKMLLLRSGNKCAYPGCDHVVFNDKDKLVAECCHIEAALPGGERYNVNQTEENRRSIENLLFLCHKHHVETDDVNIYTVEKLKKIKQDHEDNFKENPPSASIASMNNVNQVLVSMTEIERSLKRVDIKQDLILTNQEDVKVLLERVIEDRVKFNKLIYKFPPNHFISEKDFGEKLTYYIPRELYTEKDWHLKISSFDDLISYQNNKKGDNNIIRAIVIADGGVGKTTFLQYWALDIANYGKFYPIYVSLRDCKSTDILQDYIYRRHPDMSEIKKCEHRSMVLLLDGFDEIGDSINAIKQINDLSRTFPNLHILLTCRRNSFFNQFSEFDLFLLSGITDKDILQYIQNLYPNGEIPYDHFIEEILSNGFQNLLYNPFYLKILIYCYLENKNSLKISKKELIDNLLIQRKSKDNLRRPDLQLGKRVNQRKNERYGLMIAFTMALMNQKSLSEDELLDLLGEDGFNLAIDSLPIKKSSQDNQNQYWDFEHNIFLEHLAASVVKELSFQKIIEFGTSHGKVKTKWKDILAHLLGILDMNNEREAELSQNLKGWLTQNDPKLLFNIEITQVDPNERSNIFLQIFHEFQERTLWIDTYDIDRKKMALFGESKNNIRYVFSEIENTNHHWRRRANAALIFNEFTFASLIDKEKKEISEQYIKAIKQVNQEEDNLLYYLLISFPFSYEDDIDDIVNYTQNIRSARTRAGLYTIIGKNNLQDKYLQILLSGLSNRLTQGNDGVSFDVSTGIKLSLMNLKDADSYSAFFSYLADDIDSTFDWFQYSQDELMHIVKRGITFFNDDILVSLVDLLKKQCFELYRNADVFNLFKENENVRISIINIFIDFLRKETDRNPIYQCCIILAFFIKNEDFPKIEAEPFPIEPFRYLYLYVDKNTEISINLKKLLKDKFDHEELEVPDKWAIRKKNEFDIYFTPMRFAQECLEIFDKVKDNKLDPYKLLTEYHSKEGTNYNLSIIQFLRWNFGDRVIISKEEVSNWINSNENKYLTYLNLQISENINRLNTEDKLPPAKYEFIKQWYDKNINSADFKITYTSEDKKQYTYESESLPLIRYMLTFNFDCPDVQLCDMLNRLDDNFNLITDKINDKNLLKKTILNTLGNFKEYNSFVLKNQIIYALNNKITESYPIIIDILKEDYLSFYKGSIIIIWLQNNLSSESLLEIKNNLNQDELLIICKNLIIKNTPNKAHSILLEIIKAPKDEKINLLAIDLLIWLKDPLGLQMSLEYSKEKGIISLNDPFYGHYSSLDLPDNYLLYDDMVIYPLLIEYLDFCFSKEGSLKRGRSRKIEGNIKFLASLSEMNYMLIIKSLKEFVDSKKDIYQNTEDLNFLIEDINKEYKEKQSKYFNFQDAKNICEELIK